jgi:pimeloyl-ACP methyl ester carboxylesterase
MPQHHTTVVNGVSLHYVTAGQGDLVVLLHGWPQTWYAWRKVIPELAKFTVLAPDMRGMGDSERPKSGYNKKAVAEDIH